MKIFLSILILFLNLNLKAQLKPTTNDIALVKEISVKKFIGKTYKLSAEARTKAIDGKGLAAFMALQVGDELNVLEPTRKKSVKIANNEDWKKVEFSGEIDADASKLWLYLLTYGDGDFYFDKIRFQIKNESEVWIDVKLENADFEKSTTKSPLKGLQNSESVAKKVEVKAGISKEPNAKYNQILQIHSENAQPDNKIVYGWNKKAGKFMLVNGIRLYYEVYGTGEPLILLHGNGGSINSFSKQIPEFSKKYKVIAIDTRGQGNSKDSVSLSFSYAQFAEDLKVLLDSLNLKKVSVLGWSDGGNTALIMASKYPEYVSQLITMGANLNPTADAVSKKTLSMVQKDLKKMKAENKKELLVTIRLLEMLLKEPNINPESLKSITAKTLILAGEHDDILEKHTRLISESIINSKLMIFKGQMHFVAEESPNIFNKTVLDFLAQ